MLSLWLEQLLTPSTRPVRALGYLREALGIHRRYRRCRDHWAEHIAHCRGLIRKGIERCGQRRKALVLGGGLLHDVPLDDLTTAFREVILVDIVHPNFSRRQTRSYKNVTRITADVTNTVDDLYWVSDEPAKALPQSHPDLFIDDADVDLTVSLNILSQLPCMPIEYLARQRAHTPAAIEAYARDVIQAHLDYLRRLSGAVVLITDIERLKLDLKNHIVERRDLLFGLSLPAGGEEWDWRLAPQPEADPRHHYFRRVVGFSAWK